MLKKFEVTAKKLIENVPTLTSLADPLIEAMFFRFKNPLFPFCLFANSV